MSHPTPSDPAETIRLLERRLKVVREIDRIRDDFEEYNVRVMLINSLEFLARELDVTAAFATYFDAYQRQDTFSVGIDGLLRLEERAAVKALFLQLKEDPRPYRADQETYGGQYFALPMIIDNVFYGIIGICQRPDEPITAEHEVLLEDASMMVDTMVRHARIETLTKDELALADELDEISDTERGGLKQILAKMLPAVSSSMEASASLLFDVGRHEFELLAADALGRILWENSAAMHFEIKRCVQKCQAKGEFIPHSFDEDSRERFFAGRYIRGIVAYPLCTKARETAGTLVVLSDSPFFEGHLQLIGRAAAIIDTVILNNRRSDLLMRRMFKHVGTGTLDTLVECPAWLDPRQEEVVILSVDLVGSTEYSHQEPNTLIVFEHINHYLTIIGDIVRNRYHGTLDKYLGDEVMGLFGAPVPDKNRADNAVQCGRYILNEVQQVNRTRKKKNLPVFDVKITLGLVNCVVGEVGSAEIQQDYTVIGPEVNSVFRIATHAEPNHIITNKALRDVLDGQFHFTDLGEFEFKGCPGLVPIFRLEND